MTLDGSIEMNRELVERLGLTESDIEELVRPVRAEISRRLRLYRGEQASPRLEGREVILIDDGLATGYTMMAAIKSVSREHPATFGCCCSGQPSQHLRTFAFDGR